MAAIKPVQPGRQAYLMTSPFADAPLGDRITLVQEAYAAAKAHDPRITKVVAGQTPDVARRLAALYVVRSARSPQSLPPPRATRARRRSRRRGP